MSAKAIGKAGGLLAGTVFAMAALATGARAADYNVQGFIRQEPAIKLTDEENPYNQQGNIFNGRTVTLDSTGLGGVVTTTTRPIDSADNAFNLMATRLEVDFQANFNSNWSGFAKLRGYFQPDIFDGYGDPEFFETDLWSGGRGTFLEANGRNYMVDLPSLYLDYADGPVWLRLGNQQIAWGESLFFRVLDVPNGLDLRRHLLLDLVAEEFADERVAAPGVRGSYRVTNDIEIEGFDEIALAEIADLDQRFAADPALGAAALGIGFALVQLAAEHVGNQSHPVELRGLLGGDLAAIAQHGHAVGERKHLIEEVGNEDDAEALVAQLAHLVELVGDGRVAILVQVASRFASPRKRAHSA